MTVLGIIALLSAIGFVSYERFNNRSANASQLVSASLLQSRAYAMSHLSSVRLRLNDNGTLIAEQAPRCNSEESLWKEVPELALTPPDKVSFGTPENANLGLCFTSRGITEKGGSLLVTDSQGRLSIVTVYLSGAVSVS